jgi:dynein heavy chain
MTDKVCDEYELVPYTNGKLFSFKVSQLNTYKAYENHIEKGIKEESPVSIGMHPNTETASRIAFANEMFDFLLDILPLESGDAAEEEEDASGGGGGGLTQMINEKVDFIRERVPADKVADWPGRQFEVNKVGIDRKESKPFQNCFIQEFERLNKLTETMTIGLNNLKLAQEGKVNFTEEIEVTQNCLLFERIPEFWMKWSFATQRSLSSWVNLIKLRIE